LLNKQIHQSKRQFEAFESTGSLGKSLEKDLERIIKNLEKSKIILEKKIREITQKEYGETLKMLLKISGVGIKTATMMCVITENFTKFENHKQLTAYVGFSPRIFTSGTSVKGRGHICKMGKGQIRKLLYLCSWSAKRVNKTCIEMYERLKAKGKPERVIKVAIANKLINRITHNNRLSLL
jgi:transposase